MAYHYFKKNFSFFLSIQIVDLKNYVVTVTKLSFFHIISRIHNYLFPTYAIIEINPLIRDNDRAIVVFTFLEIFLLPWHLDDLRHVAVLIVFNFPLVVPFGSGATIKVT